MSGDTPANSESAAFGVDRAGMLDVWIALGGDGLSFERMMAEDRRTDADTWAQLLALVAENYASLLADTNPPCGPEFEALMSTRSGSSQGGRSDG